MLSPPASDRSRSKEGGRRAILEKQEIVETVTVSQTPVVSDAAAVVAPPVGGTTVAELPSAVQDLARFFLSLAGSSSLGAVGGVAGVAVPASGVEEQLLLVLWLLLERSFCCFRCCARLVRPSAASGGLPL